MGEQHQRIAEGFAIRDAGSSACFGHSLAVARDEGVQQRTGGGIFARLTENREDELAAAVAARTSPRHLHDPVIERAGRIAEHLGGAPFSIDLVDDGAKTGDGQILLRAEMPIERHLVAIGGGRDLIDADTLDAALAEEIARRIENAFARLRRIDFSFAGGHQFPA